MIMKTKGNLTETGRSNSEDTVIPITFTGMIPMSDRMCGLYETKCHNFNKCGMQQNAFDSVRVFKDNDVCDSIEEDDDCDTIEEDDACDSIEEDDDCDTIKEDEFYYVIFFNNVFI